MASAVLPLNYLPSLSWWATAIRYRDVMLEVQETFPKQTYRNRCHIHSAQGCLPLSIPVIRVNGNHTLTKDVLTDQGRNWQTVHWRTMVSAYNKTPYFLYYKDEFLPVFEQAAVALVEFNNKLLQVCCKVLRLRDLTFSVTETYRKEYSIPDFRESLHPKKDISAIGYTVFPRYIQAFEERNGFIPDLSIIDLIFNEGPGSLDILKRIIDGNRLEVMPTGIQS